MAELKRQKLSVKYPHERVIHYWMMYDPTVLFPPHLNFALQDAVQAIDGVIGVTRITIGTKGLYVNAEGRRRTTRTAYEDIRNVICGLKYRLEEITD